MVLLHITINCKSFSAELLIIRRIKIKHCIPGRRRRRSRRRRSIKKVKMEEEEELLLLRTETMSDFFSFKLSFKLKQEKC